MNLNPQNTLASRHRQEFEWALRDKDIKLDTHTVDTLCEIIKTFLLERDEDGYQEGYDDGYQEGYEHGSNEEIHD